MKVGIVVNVMDTHDAGQTTYRLAASCVNLGHEVWITSTGNLSCDPDDTIGALARTVPAGKYPSSAAFVDALNGPTALERWITVDALDVLLLRSNPSVQNPWAQYAGIHFGRIVMRHGVIVLNDPNGLAKATDKLYLQTFPEVVRPRTLVTRSEQRIREFAAREGTIVLKPLQGSGGKGVFLVPPSEHANLGEMVRAISRDGYVIAQEYLPAAVEGDTRLFLINGIPLQHKGRYAAFRRVRSGDDVRSNIHAGGRLRKATVDATILRVAEIVRPRLVEDGMFLVGLDIVGDKLMEINVFNPGGLGNARRYEKVDFTHAVIHALERKVQYMSYYRRKFSNVEMATL
jgi:glutathione synthase